VKSRKAQIVFWAFVCKRKRGPRLAAIPGLFSPYLL